MAIIIMELVAVNLDIILFSGSGNKQIEDSHLFFLLELIDGGIIPNL